MDILTGSYVILLFTASDSASINHIHNWMLLLLWLHPFILSGVISPWSPVGYWAPTDLGVHLSASYLFAFSYCSWGSQGRNTEVICHSLLQWTTFCQTSPPWPVHLGWPHTAWLSLTELDKAVVPWSDWLVFCDYGFSVPALWCPLSLPTVLQGFPLLWMGGIASQLLTIRWVWLVIEVRSDAIKSNTA